MNPFFARIPLVKLLVPFLLGIAAAYSFGFVVSTPVFISVLLFCLVIIAIHRRLLLRSLNWSGLDGTMIALAFFITGAGITSFNIEKQQQDFPAATKVQANLFVRLLKDPVVKERTVKLLVETRAYEDSGKWGAMNERMIVYLARDPAAEKLKYGDELLLNTLPGLVEGPKNPDEFDYRAYLLRQHIRRQAFVKNGRWKLTAHEKGNAFMAMALNLRRYFLGKLHEYGVNGEEGSVAAALLLGASDQLDPGLLQAYSASGTMHVLSVSGMHVALVYLVLMRLLAPLGKFRYGKWLSFLLQLFFLWFYATLTGLCPSVLRSVTMLSVVILGRAFGRQAHILNSLAASALILLIADPLLLYDVGFQLSYLAVAGIVLLQPKLEEKWSPKFWLTRQAWGILTVTIVAQVFTFPLGLYYFRQFPTYFLLSNLVVIPLATLTMYTGLCLLIVSPFAFLAKPVAWIFCILLKLLNLSVEEIEQLPHAVMQFSAWEPPELLLLFALTILLVFFLLRRKGYWINFAFISSFLLLTGFVKARKEQFSEERLVIFELNHSSAIGIVSGKNALLLADSALLKKDGDIDFHIHPFFENRGFYDETILPLSDSLSLKNDFLRMEKSWLFACGKKIFIADAATNSGFAAGSCDLLLLRENTRIPVDTLISRLHPSLVIADGSDSKKKTEKWKTICEIRKVSFYDVKESGALVIER